MNRFDLQKVAELRLREAKALYSADCYDGAYYLAGYAVECALKACITQRFKEFDFPDLKFVNAIYTHSPVKLLELSGLAAVLNRENSLFRVNWRIVQQWTEGSRYESGKTHTQATELIIAIGDPVNGVLTCLRKHW